MTKVPELGQKILEKKYYYGNEKSPEDVFRRVSRTMSIPDVLDKVLVVSEKHEIAENGEAFLEEYLGKDVHVCLERKRAGFLNFRFNPDYISEGGSARRLNYLWKEESEKYYELMCNLDFMPSTPILINSGINNMLSSCFFLRVEDSLDDIFDKVKEVALISKLGAGVGLDFSSLRPIGYPIKNTRGTSSGVVSFIKVFNETGNQIKSGGIRRAAFLGSLRIDHPEIVRFILAKTVEKEISNFNLSVFVTDEFMEMVKKGHTEKTWLTKFKDKTFAIRKSDGMPVEVKIENKVDDEKYYTAEDIWNLLCESAHKNGEPGIIFIDRINRGDIFLGKFGSMGVNACAEQVLHHGSACNLASINLSNFFDDEKRRFDFERFEEVVKLGVRFLDNTIQMNNFPLDLIRDRVLEIRPIGLGIMGLHDLLLKMEMKYGSSESLDLIDDIMRKMKNTAEDASEELATTRGMTKAIRETGVKRRNSTLLTVPPTGTISLICGCSSGIEPVFKWKYPREDSYGKHDIKHWILNKFDESSLPEYAVTAHEISPNEHIAVQAEVQKYIDSSISKTINLAENATQKEVSEAFQRANTLRCKSITVYRAGSREKEVLQHVAQTPKKEVRSATVSNERTRPRVLFGATFQMNTPEGKCYITINEDHAGTRECLVAISKSGSSSGAFAASLGRLISNNLQYGAPVESVVQHLIDQKSDPVWEHGRAVKSVPDAVARALQEYHKNYEGFSEYMPEDMLDQDDGSHDGELSGDFCVECGSVMVMEGGCSVCKNCGFSRCG